MNPSRHRLPIAVTALIACTALLHGPIGQLPNYHDFADQAVGIAHVHDVLSNAGFALVAFWGWVRLSPQRANPALANGWAGYRLFLIGLFLTALGSSFYHLAPDNTRLVWDRLPIALACGGLLAGVWGDTRRQASDDLAALLALAAVASVAWWHFSELAGSGDLRPYLLMQGLPLVLVPLWQALHGSPAAERLRFGGALVLYVIAKFAELNDHPIAAALGATSGHTLKHLLATVAAGLIVGGLVRRVRAVQAPSVAAAEGRPTLAGQQSVALALSNRNVEIVQKAQ